MYKIAVIGDADSVLGFRALGLEVMPAGTPAEAAKLLHQAARDDCAVIYLTENMARGIKTDIDRYKYVESPAIILIPGRDGSHGIGRAAVKESIEKAVGADILADK